MRIKVWHNDEHYHIDLQAHPDPAVGFEVASIEPWPETAWLRRTVLSKALELAAKAARHAVKRAP